LAIEVGLLLAGCVAIVAWIFFRSAPETVTQPPLAEVTQIEVIVDGKVVRKITDPKIVSSSLLFLNAKRHGWSVDTANKFKTAYEVVYLRNGNVVARLRGSEILFELHRAGKTYTRVASVEDHLAALTSLGVPRPPEHIVTSATNTTFNKFLRILSSAWDPNDSSSP
jgi:hypothetical protein